jgi:hypothetical protein
MAVYPLRCGDDAHAANAAAPGWHDGAVGTVEMPDDAPPERLSRVLGGYLCDGCVHVRRQAAAAAEVARSARAVEELGFDDGGRLAPEVYAGLAVLYAKLKALTP